MDKQLKGFIEFEGKVWFVDFTNSKEGFVIEIVEPNGSRRDASKADGDLMEVLTYGEKIPDPSHA